jgi:hypothetical protein
MAIINHLEKMSTIQIKKEIHMVFGNLFVGETPIEKIKFSIDAFKEYFAVLGEDAPNVVMNWKLGQEGDWVLSDDYRIVQILRRKDHDYDKSYNKAIIRTCVGTFAINEKAYFDTDFEQHPDRYRVSNKQKEFVDRIKEREHLTTAEAAFCRRVASGQDKVNAYMKSFSTKDVIRANNMSNILVRQERIQQQVVSDVERILERQGVTKDYIIQKYKELIDDGLLDLKNCSGSVRAALKDLADMSAMMPSKNVQSSQSKGVFEEFSDDMLDRIEAAEANVVEPSQLPESIDFNTDISDESTIDDIFEQETSDIINKAGRSLLS